MSLALASVGHTTALVYLVWGAGALQKIMEGSVLYSQRGQHYQWLTVQALLLTEVTLVLCLLSNVFPNVRKLAAARRFLIMITLPLSFVVSSVYWSMCMFLPAWIASQTGHVSEHHLDILRMISRLPLSVDIAIHLCPFIALVTHFFLVEKKYGSMEVRVWAPTAATVFGVWYASFQEWCAAHNGNFSYPFLEVPPQFRFVIYGAAVLIARYSFKLLNNLHRGSSVPGDTCEAVSASEDAGVLRDMAIRIPSIVFASLLYAVDMSQKLDASMVAHLALSHWNATIGGPEVFRPVA